MRRTIGAAIAAVLLALGTAGTADAHTTSPETWNICYWWQIYYFGPEDNGIYTDHAYEVHWWNRHQVVCEYEPIGWVLLYDRGSGKRAWIH